MSLDAGPSDRPSAAGGGNGVVHGGDSNRMAALPMARLRLNPNKDHKPECYDDLQLDFSPAIFSSLEGYLPPSMLGLSRDDKVKFMREILLKYLPHGERNRVCHAYTPYLLKKSSFHRNFQWRERFRALRFILSKSCQDYCQSLNNRFISVLI